LYWRSWPRWYWALTLAFAFVIGVLVGVVASRQTRKR
jgi:hypothetical protein